MWLAGTWGSVRGAGAVAGTEVLRELDGLFPDCIWFCFMSFRT